LAQGRLRALLVMICRHGVPLPMDDPENEKEALPCGSASRSVNRAPLRLRAICRQRQRLCRDQERSCNSLLLASVRGLLKPAFLLVIGFRPWMHRRGIALVHHVFGLEIGEG